VILACARRGWPLIAGGLSAIVLMDILSLYAPQLIKQAVDELARGGASGQGLLRMAVALAGLALAVALLRMLGRPLLMTLGRKVERELRETLGRRLLAKPQEFFDGQAAGQVMARATYDLNNLRLASGYGLQAAWDSLLTLTLALAYMLWLSPWLTLLAALPVLSIPWLTRRQSILFHGCHQSMQASFSALSEEAADCLGAIRLVKVHDLAGIKREGFGGLSREHRQRNLELSRVTALYLPVMALVIHLSQAVVWGAGGALAVLGRVSAGDIVAFSAYVVMMKGPLIYSGYLINLYQRARSSAQRLEQIFDSPGLDESLAAKPPQAAPQVSIQDLSFSYPGARRPVLSEVRLELAPGSRTALVGPVGSGKSTLLKLLAGLYPAPTGAISLAGRDLGRIPPAELHKLVGMVPQEPFIFSATVAENLSLTRPGTSLDDIWRVLALAGLEEEVRALPQGLDTELGQQGHTLSGGQRARLALSRTLLADPPLLLLDDPLSAVDPLAEAGILERLGKQRQDKSILLVSHRPGSLGFADEILLLDRGRLAARGTLQELMETSPLFRRLMQRQLLQRLGRA
jgi:ATP-binding cassette subfamily B multidrug efflux pump